MHKHFSRTAAALTIAALTACSGGGGVGGPNAPVPGPVPPTSPVTAGILVGVGDSLTAGYQSSGLLGVPATFSGSLYPGSAVPPGQESGFFALMINQMTGNSQTALAVLPLIKAPGLGDQLVPTAGGLASTHLSCDAFNAAAYSSTGWQSVRVDPSAGIADLGVPGITMHEAVAMTGPLTGPQSPNSAGTGCNGYTAIPGDQTSGNLQSLVQGESEMYYPVLGGFQSLGAGKTTELTAALSLNPHLTTVWLGANDLLKFTFSGGTLNPSKGNPITDTPQQLAADLTQIVTSLTKAGSKVLVADLPTLLPTTGRSVPQFFSNTYVPADLATLFVALSKGAISPAAGGAYAAAVMTQLEKNPNLPAAGGWYLTETGFFAVVQQAFAAIQANPGAPDFSTLTLDPSGANSGLGGAYLSPALVAQVQQLNAAYNQAIDKIATSSGSNVALVPITTLFQTAATSGVTVAPGETMTLQFGGGLVSWDGLHPSNTGYAVVANAFIQTADTAFKANIPALSALDLVSIANGGSLAIGGTVQPDPYNPFVVGAPFPLP